MPIVEKKEVVTQSSSPVADQVSQTSTVSETPTGGEVQEAQADRGNAWVWYIVGIIDLFLLLRFAFYMFGARAVGFADFLYSITYPFVAPFRGIFPNPAIDGSSYFDTAALVGIFAYAALGWIITRLIDLATRPNNSSKI